MTQEFRTSPIHSNDFKDIAMIFNNKSKCIEAFQLNALEMLVSCLISVDLAFKVNFDSDLPRTLSHPCIMMCLLSGCHFQRLVGSLLGFDIKRNTKIWSSTVQSESGDFQPYTCCQNRGLMEMISPSSCHASGSTSFSVSFLSRWRSNLSSD